MRTKISHVTLTPGVEREEHIPFIKDAEVQIEGGRIVYAGPAAQAPAFQPDEIIDGTGCLAMPGLVNLHTHTPMTLLRGIGGNKTLECWLHESIFPLEACLDDDAVRAGSDLGIAEMLRFGTTSFCDMYMRMDEVAKSVRDSGMRALLGHGVVDFDESCADVEPGLRLAENWNHACDDRIRVALAPHSEGATTPKALKRIVQAAREMDLPIHVHVSETKLDRDESLQRRGVKPPAYLESLGVFERPVIAAHCVWFDEDDIAIFRKHDATIVHNPVSNLKLASGIAPIPRMLELGCKVALGTDGVSSNNNLNLWEEMKLMGILHKGVSLDPTVVAPAQVFAAATSVGAKAMGYDDLGLIRPGYRADLILVDLDTPQATPAAELEDHVLYSVQGSDVRLTMVDGKVLYRDGEYKTLDVKDAMARSEAAIARMKIAAAKKA